LKDYFEEAARTVFSHGGVLDKFIGDGVMALFGVLNHKDDNGVADAMNAVRAGLELRTRFEVVVGEWMEKWKLYTPQKIEISLGCGIHTGEALVGNVGTDFRDQFTALGPHVNFASRIEGRSKHGEVLLSQSTETRVKAHFVLSPAGTIDDIKNIPGEFKIFEAVTPAVP
jgi:class 3 adenylate cyclase